MNRKYSIRIVSDAHRDGAIEAVRQAPDGYVVTIQEQTRTLDQNAKLWPMLRDLSEQIEWHGHTLSPDEWKDFATATLKQQTIVPDIDGTGFIAVGGHTSNMTKRQFSDLIEILYMIGARVGVGWSERAMEVFNEYGVN